MEYAKVGLSQTSRMERFLLTISLKLSILDVSGSPGYNSVGGLVIKIKLDETERAMKHEKHEASRPSEDVLEMIKAMGVKSFTSLGVT